MTKYKIVTFGCQANEADSERIAAELESKGYQEAKDPMEADHVVINTCMVRQMAEDRVYGLYENLIKNKASKNKPEKIVVTGCMVGAAMREPTGKFIEVMKRRMPLVDEFLPIEEVGFDHQPVRRNNKLGWVPISNGCNNFCTFCIVPFSRGREISRPLADVLAECKHLEATGYEEIMLIGQNVNSYGSDLVLGSDNVQTLRDTQDLKFFEEDPRLTQVTDDGYPLPDGTRVRPTLVKHLGKMRIPTLFPQLLELICKKCPEFKKVSFISSNPWDFSDDLITVMQKYEQVNRELHLPVQAGSDEILKRMNRWYTKQEYLNLVEKLKLKIPDIEITTDIIVGFPGETEEQFEETVDLAKQVGFKKAYIARYSPRPGTAATQAFDDNLSHQEKKRRWWILEELINQPNLRNIKASKNS